MILAVLCWSFWLLGLTYPLCASIVDGAEKSIRNVEGEKDDNDMQVSAKHYLMTVI